MENFQEQELPLQLCFGAPKQKEELSDCRNRQAAGNDRRQNEAQIWQRGLSTHILRKNISSPEKDQWRQARARAWVSGTN
jgi:hypothetical protein